MKSGKSGFGIREMIIYTSLLLLLLLYVSFSINTLYKNIEDNKNSSKVEKTENKENNNSNNKNENNVIDENYYKGLENKLKSAAINYLNSYSYDLTDNVITIDSTKLEELNMLDKMYDKNGSTQCDGYTNIYQSNERIFADSYINCGEYVTEGY